MSFAEALLAMKQGERVTLPWWWGYWYITDGRLRIHCANGVEFDAFSSENTDVLQTLSYMGANCWELYRVKREQEGCPWRET